MLVFNTTANALLITNMADTERDQTKSVTPSAEEMAQELVVVAGGTKSSSLSRRLSPTNQSLVNQDLVATRMPEEEI
jgi:hypothetical protein